MCVRVCVCCVCTFNLAKVGVEAEVGLRVVARLEEAARPAHSSDALMSPLSRRLACGMAMVIRIMASL